MKKWIVPFSRIVSCIVALAAVACSNSDEPGTVLEVSQSEMNFTTAGGTRSLTVTASEAWSLSAPEWVECTPHEGDALAQVSVKVGENTAAEREGEIVVTSGTVTRSVAVKQDGVDFRIDRVEFAFDADGTPLEATIVSKYAWRIERPASVGWLTITPMEGEAGTTTVHFTPAPITDRTPRPKELLMLYYGSTFTMIAVGQSLPNTPPAAPQLVSPADEESDVAINASFMWKASVDPDGDAVTYRLMVSENGGTTWATVSTAQTSVKLPNFMSRSTDCVWKVEASDPFGGKSESALYSFRTGDGGAYADGQTATWQMESAGAPMPVHLVFTGDGFIAEDYTEGGAFDQAVETAINAFFSVEPYKSYRSYFRVSTVAAHSEERGATVEKAMTGCPVQKRNTVFSCVLEGGNSTGITCNAEKVFTYAKKVQGVTEEVLKNTTVFVIINLDVYAGTCIMYNNGKSVSMCPTGRKSFGEVVSHEGGGHGFGRLLDEYRYYNETLPASESSQITAWRGLDPYYGYNVSLTNDPNKAHWSHYLSRAGYEAVGFYEGACLYERGIWRPEYNSCMNNNIPYYNAPSREAIVRRICRASGTAFDLEKFVQNDHVRSASAPMYAPASTPSMFVPFAPPILVEE
ncbi:MAG: hypothetical protein K2K43_02245 [Alistipes sp.]|nr:hypothetical protein [Alistipes sp.]